MFTNVNGLRRTVCQKNSFNLREITDFEGLGLPAVPAGHAWPSAPATGAVGSIARLRTPSAPAGASTTFKPVSTSWMVSPPHTAHDVSFPQLKRSMARVRLTGGELGWCGGGCCPLRVVC